MIIPNIWKNKIHVPVTTNQSCYLYHYPIPQWLHGSCGPRVVVRTHGHRGLSLVGQLTPYHAAVSRLQPLWTVSQESAHVVTKGGPSRPRVRWKNQWEAWVDVELWKITALILGLCIWNIPPRIRLFDHL